MRYSVTWELTMMLDDAWHPHLHGLSAELAAFPDHQADKPQAVRHNKTELST